MGEVAHTLLFDIDHESVVVTGGGSGIGRAVVLTLAGAGVTVHVLGRTISRLEETVELCRSLPGKAVAVGCDVENAEAVDEAFGQIEAEGAATGLVHAAAHVVKMPARDMTPADFQRVVSSTLLGSFNVLRRWALPLLDSGVQGAAVMVTSNSASRGTPGVSHSSAGKAGVEALTKSLAREWGPSGLKINAVGPGPFPVEKSEAMWADPQVAKRVTSRVALGRYGELPEIAGPIVFLLTRAAAFTTGQTLRVDGGMSLTDWTIRAEEMHKGINNMYEHRTERIS
jgi:NAD(P)-dependent dehydrogenase (short-subunit alcohol dehydrogenase family)